MKKLIINLTIVLMSLSTFIKADEINEDNVGVNYIQYYAHCSGVLNAIFCNGFYACNDTLKRYFKRRSENMEIVDIRSFKLGEGYIENYSIFTKYYACEAKTKIIK